MKIKFKKDRDQDHFDPERTWVSEEIYDLHNGYYINKLLNFFDERFPNCVYGTEDTKYGMTCMVHFKDDADNAAFICMSTGDGIDVS